MINEEMTNEEKANTDKLEYYFREKIKVHIVLKREISLGKKAWINGPIIRRPSNRLWIINDIILGEIRLSISEIASWGVNEFTEVKRW